jgi:hypothetical protein
MCSIHGVSKNTVYVYNPHQAVQEVAHYLLGGLKGNCRLSLKMFVISGIAA